MIASLPWLRPTVGNTHRSPLPSIFFLRVEELFSFILKAIYGSYIRK